MIIISFNSVQQQKQQNLKFHFSHTEGHRCHLELSFYMFICIRQITTGEQQQPAPPQSATRRNKNNLATRAQSSVAERFFNCDAIYLPPPQLRPGHQADGSVNTRRRAGGRTSPSVPPSLHGNLLMISRQDLIHMCRQAE